MRHVVCFVSICVVLNLLQPRTTLAYHDMTCHPPPPPSGGMNFHTSASAPLSSEEYNLVVPGATGATSLSCSDSGGDQIDVALPPDDVSAIEHVPGIGQAGRYWLFEPVSQPFLDARFGLSAELPNFTKPDGTPLLTQYRETNFDFVLQTARTFTPAEAFSVSSGEIGGWPGATLLEMPASFTLDELLAADSSRFPVYTGAAQVADLARIEVVPEPASPLLLLGGAIAIAGRRRIVGRS